MGGLARAIGRALRRLRRRESAPPECAIDRAMADTRWPRYVLPSLLALGAFAAYRGSVKSTQVAASPSASASALPGESDVDRLTGLKLGDPLGEWKLVHVAPDPAPNGAGQLRLEFERKGLILVVWIAARGKVPLLPVATDRYELGYGAPRGSGEPAPPDAPKKLADALAERVKAREAAAPVPGSLGP
jgi:hypothetical protein